MKRYATAIFVFLSSLVIVPIFFVEYALIKWVLAFILMLLAAYFTKYLKQGSSSIRNYVKSHQRLGCTVHRRCNNQGRKSLRYCTIGETTWQQWNACSCQQGYTSVQLRLKSFLLKRTIPRWIRHKRLDSDRLSRKSRQPVFWEQSPDERHQNMLRSNKHQQNEFEFVSIEDLVPEDHLDKYIEFLIRTG